MQSPDDQLQRARQLLAGAFSGVLSTHSLEHAGYPFGSVVPYVLDQDGLPLLLLSNLSQHTRNLQANPHCGLLVSERATGDVQRQARLSAVGEVLQLPDSDDSERFFAYFPQSKMYFEELDFRFYRFEPVRFHWNGGFATARWFSVDRLVQANPLDRTTQVRILTHMNEDHVAALRHYLSEHEPMDSGATPIMVGIDADGIDLRVENRLHRVPLAESIASASEAREVLVAMAS